MFRRKRKPSDFSFEIKGHLQLEIERLREQGMSEDQARAIARRSFGNLAGLGIYGVISYIVTARTHEIGIRIALGAERSSILQMVLRQGLGLAIAGAAVGLVGAVIVSHLMQVCSTASGHRSRHLSRRRPSSDRVAVLACYIPACRAFRVDPSFRCATNSSRPRLGYSCLKPASFGSNQIEENH